MAATQGRVIYMINYVSNRNLRAHGFLEYMNQVKHMKLDSDVIAGLWLIYIMESQYRTSENQWRLFCKLTMHAHGY
jgi:hypothetical protein